MFRSTGLLGICVAGKSIFLSIENVPYAIQDFAILYTNGN